MVTVTPGALAFVFVAGLITALATGLGALPFFVFDDISDRWNVVLWGLASGIMLAASGFGLFAEGLTASNGLPVTLALGVVAGVALVVVADRVLHHVDVGGGHDHDAHDDEDAALAAAVAAGDYRKLVLILGVLTVHSFPEGVAIGVSFADIGLAGGVAVLGVAVPLLAVFMTVAISIHNVPEGTAIAIPLRSLGASEWKMVGAAVFSSLPQPVGAVVAFAFVRWARAFLPFGFGFAGGAMVYLVLTEFVPEALDQGADLSGGGQRELLAGVTAGVVLMLPLLVV